MSAERKHHPYSPSTLQSREVCPCFESKQDVVVHERTVAGSKAHNVVETGIDDNQLSDEDAVAAAECLDFVERRRVLLEDARSRIPEASPLTELKEVYLPIDECIFEDEYLDFRDGTIIKRKIEATTAGYVDHVIINHDQTYAEMIDYKFGLWPVEQADNNLQGISYALGLFRAYPTLKKILFWFMQPHLEQISSVVFERENIPALYLRVQVVVAKAREARKRGDFSTARPMVPVCNFCANIGVCPKVTEFVCRVGSKFHPLEIPENITPTMVHDPKNSALGKRLAAVVKIWADAFSRQLADRILRGEAPLPEGYRIETRANRVIVDKDKFKEITLKHMTEAEYLATFDPSFGPIEDLIKEKSARGSKKTIVESYQAELLASGAVKRDLPYSFLKAVASTKNT